MCGLDPQILEAAAMTQTFLHGSSVYSSLITLNYMENLLFSRNLSLLYCVPTPNHPINPLGGCLGSVL